MNDTALAHPIPEAAQHIGVGRTTVYRLIDDGELPTITIGRRRLIAHADLVAFVERRRTEAGAA